MWFCAIGTSIGKRYARTDELGVPFAITVDSASSVTIRERDSKQQIRVNVDEVASVIKEVTDGQSTWGDVLWKYPTHSSWSLELRIFISALVCYTSTICLTIVHQSDSKYLCNERSILLFFSIMLNHYLLEILNFKQLQNLQKWNEGPPCYAENFDL